MRYPVSEALDRYSILWLKRFFGCDVDREFETIENYLRDELRENWQLVRQSVQLGTCNALQWMLEECVSPFEDDECVVEAALRIRQSNVQRVAAKNGLADLLGCLLPGPRRDGEDAAGRRSTWQGNIPRSRPSYQSCPARGRIA